MTSQPWHDGQLIYKSGDAAQPMAIATTAEDAAAIVTSLARNGSTMNIYDLFDAAAEINGGHSDEYMLRVTRSGASLVRESRCVVSASREDGDPCRAIASELADKCSDLIELRRDVVKSAENALNTAHRREREARELMERLRAFSMGEVKP